MRGGAFNNNPENLRCGYRNDNNPRNSNDNNGFRVVVSHGFPPVSAMPGGHGCRSETLENRREPFPAALFDCRRAGQRGRARPLLRSCAVVGAGGGYGDIPGFPTALFAC